MGPIDPRAIRDAVVGQFETGGVSPTCLKCALYNPAGGHLPRPPGAAFWSEHIGECRLYIAPQLQNVLTPCAGFWPREGQEVTDVP